MRVAVGGGGGNFALNFVKLLNDRGVPHFGIGRSPRREPAFWQVSHHYKYQALHLVTQLPAVMAVLDTERPDVIVNYAAQGEGAASFGDNAPDFFETNCVALVRFVCELRKRTYLKRFVHIGSSEVYGSVDTPSKESDLLNPSSPYAISKAAFDQYLNTMFKIHGFPMNIIRPSNCYTPGQQLHRIIPKAIVLAMSGKKLTLDGGGKAQKSYLHADDLSRAVLDVIEKAPLGETYNVGPVSPISIKALIDEIAEVSGISSEEFVEIGPERVGQDSKYHLDSTKIAKDCQWTQTMNLGRGINTMVEWVRKHPELLTMDTAYRHRV